MLNQYVIQAGCSLCGKTADKTQKHPFGANLNSSNHNKSQKCGKNGGQKGGVG